MFNLLKKNLINIPGKSIKKKLIVIESDDWGGIRMPSKAVFNKLQAQKLSPENDPYLKFDSLATSQDMQALYDILKSVKDKNNNPAIITANTVMGNPDFEKIKLSNFQNYYWESFKSTWKRYPNCNGTEDLWKQGQENKLLRFQCHGREHLNVDRWIKDLKNNKILRKAFDLEMISISSQPSALRFGYMESLDYFSENEKKKKKKIVEEGLMEFNKYFGFSSKSYIANCYIWDDFIEQILKSNGVNFIQGISNQIKPVLKNNLHYHAYKRNFLEKNKYGQMYLVKTLF